MRLRHRRDGVWQYQLPEFFDNRHRVKLHERGGELTPVLFVFFIIVVVSVVRLRDLDRLVSSNSGLATPQRSAVWVLGHPGRVCFVRSSLLERDRECGGRTQPRSLHPQG
jgi:hypothetical protein